MPNARAPLSVDVAVIGAGTAGLAAYRAATKRGARVVLIEAGPYGTTCARVGCMPSKLLVAAAEAAHHAQKARALGVHAEITIDGEAVLARVRRERDRFVGFVVDATETIPEEHRLLGRARFTAPGKLDVSGQAVLARAIVIATGSSPVVPTMFEGIRDVLAVNDDVFDWASLPSSLAVFGAGVVGLELGQALARLGVRVRLFGRGGRLGPVTDPVVHEAARVALSRELHLDLAADVRSVEPASRGLAVSFAEPDGTLREEHFERALIAAGRRSNLGSLGLDRAGLLLDERGMPSIDRHTLQARGGAVFIPGDANDDVPVLHEAADEGYIAGENASRFPDVVPHPRRSALAIAFTEPQLAIVGPNYASLAARGELAIGQVSFVDQGRSRVMQANEGALRVYADRRSGLFLGAEMAGPRAEHIAHLLAWAHQQQMTIPGMLAMPFYHPVVEEGLRTALRDAASKLTS
jgi:dihydrolipoamide dehydrogenase